MDQRVSCRRKGCHQLSSVGMPTTEVHGPGKPLQATKTVPASDATQTRSNVSTRIRLVPVHVPKRAVSVIGRCFHASTARALIMTVNRFARTGDTKHLRQSEKTSLIATTGQRRMVITFGRIPTSTPSESQSKDCTVDELSARSARYAAFTTRRLDRITSLESNVLLGKTKLDGFAAENPDHRSTDDDPRRVGRKYRRVRSSRRLTIPWAMSRTLVDLDRATSE